MILYTFHRDSYGQYWLELDWDEGPDGAFVREQLMANQLGWA